MRRKEQWRERRRGRKYRGKRRRGRRDGIEDEWKDIRRSRGRR